MTRLKPCRASARVFAAILLLVFLGGCGASYDVAADRDDAADKPAAADDTPRGSATDSAAGEQPPFEQQSDAADVDQPAQEPDTAATAAKSSGATPAAASGAVLSGRIVFDGPAPERRVINMTKDPMCIELHGDKEVLDEATIVSDDGGVKNVFVYIQRGAPDIEYPIPEEPVVLNQKDCMYRPRVGGVRVGQKLLVSNGDPVTHNVRSYPIRNRAFNFGQPKDSGPRERIFDEAEREVDVQCDIHPWMRAFLFVMDHPFFSVSDDDGTYAIDSVPAGEYTLAVWHETFGKQQQKITVGDGDLGNVNFRYEP